MHSRLQITLLLLAVGCSPSWEAGVSREPLTDVATLTVSRSKANATLLPNGLVLFCGGTDQTDGLATAELFDPQTGLLRAAPPLPTPHFFHTSTLLRSGEVLVMGGKDTFTTSSSDVASFDPSTERWTPLPPLAVNRERHTTTALNDGRLLIAGSRSGFLGGEVRDRDGGLTPTGPMLLIRGEHTASRLPDGRVLVVGGFNDPSMVVTATTEVFDPGTNAWTDAGTMPIPARYNHAAVTLADGRLLIVGGAGPLRSSGPMSSAALYQPRDGGWTLAPSMNQARALPSGTLLPSGKVLIFGRGSTSNPGEVFDPLDGGWALLGASSAGFREGHAATILPSGEVLLAGGINGGGLTDLVEVYDPSTPSWSGVGPLPGLKARHTLTLLPSGQVLAAGGNGSTGGAALFNPSTDIWTPTGALQTARAGHTATLMRSGKVLLSGGADTPGTPLAECEVFDPGTGLFSTTAPMSTPRVDHRATLLPSGKVLVTGGRSTAAGPATASAELYDPQLGSWSPAGNPMSRGRDQHFATLLQDGRVLVVGELADVDLYEPLSDRFTAGLATNVAHARPSGALLPSGKVFLAGGASTVEEFDPDGGAWTPVGSLSVARQGIAVVAMPGGKVLLAGGLSDAGSSGAVELYDPRARVVLALPSRPVARADHPVTRLLDGRALVAGGLTPGGIVASSETFDDGLTPINLLQPVLAGPLPETRPGALLDFVGSGFLRPGSQGLYNEGEASFPLLRLERLDNLDARYAPTSEWSATKATAQIPSTIQPGWHLARVIVNGATSQGVPIMIAFPEVDAGMPDAGMPDAGVDGGGSDAGAVDAGAVDAGAVDAGSGDAGVDPPKSLLVSCGCGPGAGAPALLAMALVLLWRSRRPKAASARAFTSWS